MAGKHVVKQGECLSSIADRYGLQGWRVLWDDPGNQALRNLRKEPNILRPGDEIHIPDLRPGSVLIQTEARHRFRARQETVQLRLRVCRDIAGEPVDAPYHLTVEGVATPLEGRLSGGALEITIPARAPRADLLILDEGGTTVQRVFQLWLGALDPLETLTGVQARLKRLGYDPGAVDGIWGPNTEAALRAFQLAEGIQDEEEPFGASTREGLKRYIGH